MGTDRIWGCRPSLLATLVIATLLLGCARTPPARYYKLSSRPFATETKASSAPDQTRSIGLGPVSIPEYLERTRIVRRLSENRVQIMENDRWAEPLSDGLPRVLGENLAALLGGDQVLNYPYGHEQTIEYRVVVSISRYEGGPDNDAELTASWQVLDSAGNELAQENSHYTVETDAGVEGLVAGLSELLWELARDLAAALGTIEDQP